MKKVYIALTIMFMFLSLLVVFSMDKKVNEKEYKTKNNSYLSILVDGVDQDKFPSKETSKYLGTTCLNNEEVEFDEDDWSLSIPHISASTNCVVSFMTKGFIVNVNVEGGTVTEKTKTIQNGESSSFTLTPKDNTYMYSGVTCTGDVKTTFSNNVLTVSNVKSDSTCNVTYTNTTYDVTVVINNGTSEKDKIIVPRGGNGEVKITPSNGYKLDGSVVDCNMGIEGIINRGKLEISKVYGPGVCTVNTACDDGLTINTPKLYSYTGDAQDFRVCAGHTYKVELWGARGGDFSGFRHNHGAYTSGVFYENNDAVLYLYVGEYPSYTSGSCLSSNPNTAFNGSTSGSCSNGGGSTDMRTLKGENFYDDISVRSRLIVSAGAGGNVYYPNIGGAGGGLLGYNAVDNTRKTASQVNGHYFGKSSGNTTTGGGNGWYSGFSGDAKNGNGGSSYISGHTGCVGVTSIESSTPKSGCDTSTMDNSCSISPYGYTFTETVMIDGLGYQWYDQKGTQTKMPNPNGGEYDLGVGHNGNGYARVTRLEDNYTPTFTVKLNINNGTISKTSVSLGSGETDTATLTADTGYSLNGATVSCSADASGYINGSTLTIMNVKDNAECTVNTKPQTYVVTFNANGGTVSQGSKIVTYGSEYGELPTPTRKGYTFKGWNGKNLLKDVNSTNYYVFTNYENRITPEFLVQDDISFFRANGNASSSYIDTSWRVRYYDVFEFSKNKNYQFSFFVRSQNCYETQHIRKTESLYGLTRIYDKALKEYVYKVDNDISFANDGKWHKISASITPENDYDYLLLDIGNDVPNLYRTNCYFDISRIQIEEGDSATAYEPYYVTGDINVTQAKNHTLTAIWDYTEPLLRGADPVLDGDMVPVTLSSTDSDWTVTYADTTEEWYKYGESRWANAVRLVNRPSKNYHVGDTIEHDDISAYFVWIPRYKYKLFDMGNYNGYVDSITAKNQLIDIVFGTDTTIDTDTSCITPMTSGSSGNCAVGKYMTHPSFKSFNSKGFWVGKFETTGNINSITVLPGLTQISNFTYENMYTKAYNYNRTLDSHMMKNTEWGAVAYLSHSSYGMGNKNIYRNNYYDNGGLTGCVSNGPSEVESSTCSYQWYGTTGLNGSTTGNITGIYDMAGGLSEAVCGFRNTESGNIGLSELSVTNTGGTFAKYFDKYENTDGSYSKYNIRLLGDATGEIGPFNTTNTSGWYNDYGYMVYSSNPWFVRGGRYALASPSGLFTFGFATGEAKGDITFRLVLTPQG